MSSTIAKMTASRTVTLTMHNWAAIADLMDQYRTGSLDQVIKILLANWRQNHESGRS